MIGLVSALCLILGVAFLGVRVLSRWGRGLPGGTGRFPLYVLQRAATGPRQGVALIRVGDRVLVVGMAEKEITLLSELEAPVAQQAISGGTGNGSGNRPPAKWTSLLGISLLLALVAGAPGAAAAQAPAGPKKPASTVQTPAVQTPAVAKPHAGHPIGRTTTGAQPLPPLPIGDGPDGLKLSGAVGLAIFLGALTLLPALVLLTTSFTRVVIVLQFLRTGLGTQSAPPMQLLVAIALLITGLVMRPTLEAVNTAAIQPLQKGQITQVQAYDSAVAPLRHFMLANVHEQDLATFTELTGADTVDSVEQIPTVTVMSAFVASELKTAFQMGFVILLPFVVIDLVVAAVLTSMGMFMLPPQMISLPLKLLLFVLADGWMLTIKSLVTSFHT